MKLMYPLLSTNHVALLAGLLLIPSGSQAAQMAYEGFDYPTGAGNLTGLSGGTGWNGGWQTVNNGSADVVTASLAAGGSAPTGVDARSTGNSATLPNARRVGRLLDVSLNGPFGVRGYRDANGRIGADGTTLYLSFMQQPNSADIYYEFEFHRDNLGDPGRIGGIGNDSTSPAGNVNLRAGGTNNYSLGAGTTAVNFYVVRIDFKAGNDDVYVYRNPTSATEPGVPTLTKLAVSDMSFNGVSFGAWVGSTTVTHDELRFGQTWADVINPALEAPAFVKQPQSATTAQAGGTVGLTGAANGFPAPTYQWFKGVNPVPGQNTSTLSLSNVQPSDAGTYHLVATNSQGSLSSSDVTITVNPTPAGLLVYEGFGYDANTSLDGKNGGLGWGAPWASVDNGGGNATTGGLTAGTNAPNGYDARSMGNGSHIPNAKRSGRLLDTSPTGRLAAAGYIDGNGNVGANDKTIYISFLQQPDGTTMFYEFEFHRGNLGDPGRIGGIGNDTPDPIVSLRAPNGTKALIGPGNTAVNFYVVRIDFRDGNDDVFVYQNPISSTEPGLPTLSRFSVADMSFNGISLAAFVNGRTVKHDEIRVGQAWEDVVFGTSRRELSWVGGNNSNIWNKTAQNWDNTTDGTGVTAFSDGDPVSFFDSGSVAPPISIPANVATSTVYFNNSEEKNYTLGGAGAINASGSLTKDGEGSVTLNGPANFGAAMIVNGGGLTLNGTTTVGGALDLGYGAGAVKLAGNNSFSGSLNANAGTQVLSGTTSFSGFVSANGATTISGATTITGTGGTTLWVGNLGGANASLTIEPTGSLTMTGVFNDALVFGRDGGSATVVQNGGTVTYNPSNRDSAYIGASERNGATAASYTINGGTLEMGNMRLGLSIGPIVSTLTQTGGTINVKQLDLGSVVTTGTGNYTMTGGTLNVGSAGITSSSNLYAISLAGGTIGAAANWTSALGITLAGPVTFDSGVNKIVLDGAITGPGGLTKTGGGTLVLTGTNDYAGATTVSAGTIAGLGTGGGPLNVASGASVEPGVPGGINIGFFSCDSATLASGSTLKLEIDSTLDGVDQLLVSNALTLTGATLSISEVGSGMLPPSTTFVIAESLSSGITGTFAGLPEGASLTVGGNTLTIHYTASQVTLTTGAGSAYTTWAASQGLDGSPGKEDGFDADPEQDGIANGLEWILGGNPLASGGAPLVSSTGSAATGLTLTFTREESSIGNADLILEWDADLDGAWTEVSITQTGGTYADGVVVTVNEATTPDTVTVLIPASNGPAGKVFARLKARSN
ncbi:immunoglobulin domain-containing protein [Luteolibacter yonseiensis]|uniref:Immunoglobulin domain-containing protein n=1 Tax=Luteolibacter yonseiensis TaxID=1144680 RepID=A0A934VCL8_9BACT|nr:immunoglobulin domain-containing protein [Luteolibacter yonseiensis]MBK1816624.1 immunoglobulin domain-containing protein [Luteolibacter yonseiensis]